MYILNLKKRTIHDDRHLMTACQIAAVRRYKLVSLKEYRKLSQGNFAEYYPCGYCIPEGLPA